MILDSTREMTPAERMAYDLGRAEASAEVAALREQVASLTAERDAAVKDFKASIETDHCQYCVNTEKCERKAEREQTYAYPFKGCGFKWKGMPVTNAPTGAETVDKQQQTMYNNKQEVILC